MQIENVMSVDSLNINLEINMANKFLSTFNDSGKEFTDQQQAHYTGDNMVNYEQLLTSGHRADNAKLDSTDCENYGVLSKPEIKAHSELDNVSDANTVSGNRHDHLTKVDHTNNIISCMLSVADIRAVESDDYLNVVDDGDDDNYMVVIDDTSTSCHPSSKNVSATQQAKESSKSAGNDNNDCLVIIGESSSTSTTCPNDDYLPSDANPNKPSQYEYLVGAADATIQGFIDVVDEIKHCNDATSGGHTIVDGGMLSSMFICENYSRLLDVDKQQQEQVATESDYNHATETFDLGDYDNNIGSNVNANNVSMLLITIIITLKTREFK
jgi:hypothetical protein